MKRSKLAFKKITINLLQYLLEDYSFHTGKILPFPVFLSGYVFPAAGMENFITSNINIECIVVRKSSKLPSERELASIGPARSIPCTVLHIDISALSAARLTSFIVPVRSCRLPSITTRHISTISFTSFSLSAYSPCASFSPAGSKSRGTYCPLVPLPMKTHFSIGK